MAAADLLPALHRHHPVPDVRAGAAAPQPPSPAARGERLHPGDDRGLRPRAARSAVAVVARTGRRAEPQARCDAARGRQRGGDVGRQPRVTGGDDRRDRPRREDHPRRVLHPVAGRHDGPVLRCAGGRTPAGGARPRAARSPRELPVSGVSPHRPPAQADGSPVASDAAVPAVAVPHPAPRPAQPSEAARRRRRGGVHRIAEHHRDGVPEAR
jgi:hypothetical protein